MRKSCKHGLSLLLSLILALSLMAVGASAEEFSDMPDGWSREAVSAAVENGLLQGSNGKLDPTGLLTRAQLATVIVRAFGATEEADLSGYTDVSADDWYYAALAKAKGMAVMNGTSGSTMSPDRPISRQEVFVILARALKLTDGKAEALSAYRDAGSVAAWAVGGTAAMVSAGYVGGSNGYLLPTDSITREQFAQILYNIFGAYEQTAGVSTGNVTGSLLVNVPDVTVKNAKITGDLVVGDGVGDGDLTLENVSVGGRLVVRGGVNSIHIKGSTIFSVVIGRENGAVRVVTDSSSKVDHIVIADGRDDVIIEGKVDTIAVDTESVPVILKNARVNTLEVNGDKTDISLVGSTKVVTMNVAEDARDVKLDKEKSTSIGTIHADSDMSVSGEGSIGAVEGSGKLTDEKGDEVKPTARPTGGGGGGHTHSYAAEWTTDETYHWHAATCGHEDAKGSYGAHDYTTVISDTATCTDAGTRVMGCVCGKTVEQESPAKGHSFAEAWSWDETSHWHGATCGHDVTDSKAPHDWNDGEITTPVGCTDNGVKTYTCKDCSATRTEPIIASGHTPGDWTYGALGDLEGKHYKKCTSCGDVTATADHDWNDGEITTPAKCTEAGVKTYTCKDCGATRTEPITALGHDFANGETRSDADGHWHVCGRTGCTATDTKTPHSYDTTNCAQSATCDCGYVKPAGEHSWGAWSKVDDTTHKHVCTTCETPATAPHDWNDGEITTPAKCTEAGVKTYTCKDCGATRTEPITALGHDFANGETRSDADGHWHVCGRTGCTATDTRTPHSYDTTNCAQSASCDCGYVKPAGEHSWGAWSKVDDTTHKHVCTTCETPATAPHDWNDGEITTPVGCTDNGVKTYTCKDCGATRTEPITALGHDFANGETRSDADGHWHVCGRTGCTATDTKTPHSYGEDGKCVCGAVKPTAQPVAAPKGIVSMERSGFGLAIRMEAPDSTANINYFLISFYEDGKKEASEATCGIAADKTDFWIRHTGFNPAYNYNKVEITAYAADGYTNAVWTDDVSVTQTCPTLQTTWTYDDPSLKIRFSAAAPGFYHIGVWNGDTLIENNSSYSYAYDNGLTVSRSVNETEAAAIAAGTATVKVDGWNVTQAEKVDGKWTVAFTSYSGTATREVHVAASAWSKDAASHWHACTNTGCTEKLDEGTHDFDPTTGKCVCGAVKPTGDYLLVYTVEDGGLVIRSNIPTTTGYYNLVFSGDSTSYETGIFGSDFSTFALDSMFAGKPAVTYNKLEWKETIDDVTTTIATLNKRLTVGYSGTPINITGITLTDSEYNENQWDATFTTDAELDRSARYVLITKRGYNISTSSTYFYDGAIMSSFMKDSRYGDLGTATLYLVKVTAAVDDSGNAALTYTPLGDGYRYQLDANGISTPDDTPTNACTLSYSETNSNDGLMLTFNSAGPEAVGRQYLYFYNRDIGYRAERVPFGNGVRLGGMFVGTSATTYTGVRFVDIVDDVEQTIATLDKSLTVAYAGDAINITNFDAVQNIDEDNIVFFDFTLTTDTDLDSSASYVLFEVFDDGTASGFIVYGSERHCQLSTTYPAGETVTFYLMKATGSVDADGNATLTYTPMGDGYSWTVPNAT